MKVPIHEISGIDVVSIRRHQISCQMNTRFVWDFASFVVPEISHFLLYLCPIIVRLVAHCHLRKCIPIKFLISISHILRFTFSVYHAVKMSQNVKDLEHSIIHIILGSLKGKSCQV